MQKIPLEILNKNLFKGLIKLKYITWINNRLKVSKFGNIKKIPFQTRFVKGLLGKLNIKEPQSKAYAAYLTLKPIEKILLRSTHK